MTQRHELTLVPVAGFRLAEAVFGNDQLSYLLLNMEYEDVSYPL
jgi:hypothetical protein